MGAHQHSQVFSSSYQIGFDQMEMHKWNQMGQNDTSCEMRRHLACSSFLAVTGRRSWTTGRLESIGGWSHAEEQDS